MQIYDKIADSMYIFNRIYNEQVLNMFVSWFMTTLLAICRILSPTVQTDGIYNNYEDQVELMLDLVQTRKMEISTIVFAVNFSVMMNFAGRVISYAVLMIQYFYLYIHENI
ncbi:uncharacterized protein [Epargyreus clarus]|uniref:uncharacterized protein n=1 Tax=Epargyreus clarus TaxID=520877 RepID=UPI003C2D3467